jgi:periplasmic protein CpxP/Spy
MKLNRKSLLIAGFAATLAIAPLIVVNAQSEPAAVPATPSDPSLATPATPSDPLGDRMGGHHMGGPGGDRRGGPFERLALTDEQRTQLEAIREDAHTQVEAILTDEQRQQARAAREQFESRRAEFASLTPEQRQARFQEMRAQRGSGGHGGHGGPLAELNLTDEQREQIHSIMENARTQGEAVLTSEQRQQLQQWRDSHPERPERSLAPADGR